MATNQKDAQTPRQSLELGDLISVPITALMRSQIIGQLEAIEQFVNIGFEEVKSREGTRLIPRQLVFDYEHQSPDPSEPGTTKAVTTRVSAPLAAMLRPVPLTIDSAELEYKFAIREVQSPPTPAGGRARDVGLPGIDAIRSVLPSLPSPAPRFSAAFTTNNPSANIATPTVNIKVSLKARASSEGMSRIENLLADAITAAVSPEFDRKR